MNSDKLTITITFWGILALILVLSFSGYFLFEDTTQLELWLEQHFEWTNERYVLVLIFIVLFGK